MAAKSTKVIFTWNGDNEDYIVEALQTWGGKDVEHYVKRGRLYLKFDGDLTCLRKGESFDIYLPVDFDEVKDGN